MAGGGVTASVALNTNSVVSGQPVTVICTILNGSLHDVRLCWLTANCSPASTGIALPQIPVGGSFPTLISSGGGRLKYTWTVVANAPISSDSGNPAEPTTYSYNLGATFCVSDGTIDDATPTLLSVSYAGN